MKLNSPKNQGRTFGYKMTKTESNDKYSIGIDASNLLQGGGRTHLIELLRVIEPKRYGFDKIIVWGADDTLSFLDDSS